MSVVFSSRSGARVFSVAFVSVVLAASTMLASARAPDASYPTKPIRVIDPFPPGGATDFLDRIIAQKLSDRFG